MSLHFVCLTATGGLPIFSRKRGDCEALPFSAVGSLNGVHMFCKSQKVQLQTTHLDDGTIVSWKEFENSLTTVAIGNGYTEKVLRDLQEIIFNATVFTISLNEVKSNQSADQLKRELKKCYPIVDKLIEGLDTDLLKLSDCILPSNGTEIVERLSEFSEQIGSPFCCVVVKRQKIIAGTEGWWDLNVIDRKLLITALNASSTTQLDIPIYLPKKSPNTAYRFVCVPIGETINICTVCGAEPSLITTMHLAQHIFRNDLEILRNAEHCQPRNFSFTIPPFDAGILGILLINRAQSKYILSHNLQPAGGTKRTANGGGHHRLDILRTFFHQAVDVIGKFLALRQNSPKNVDLNSAKAIESYWVSDYHKCHAYSQAENLICVLYTGSIPTHTMRLVTQKTLTTILTEKDIVW